MDQIHAGQAVIPDKARDNATSSISMQHSPTIDFSVSDGINIKSLIGTPQLFGRVKQLRNGIMVEPIANLTMQADGRITGHGHPNEGSWMPYEHGEVEASMAFAFVTANNKWIPSSTWTQSMGGIPIGHFCDEPESSQAVQRLCLLPQSTGPNTADIVYLVASCQRFYEDTIPKLLLQLYAEGIPAERIKVVVNGSTSNTDKSIDGVEHAFSTHDAWEYSSLYEAPLRWQFDYVFMIHDTNVIIPVFRRSVESFNQFVKWDHLPASPLARCLLGHYSHDFLMRLNPWLKKADKISKKNGVIAEAGAELLLRARSALVMGDAEANGQARAAEWRELVDQFNTGTPRVRRVFPAIKLHKFIHAGPASPDKL
jgi:hypothetical protein